MEALQRLHNRGSISTGYDIDNSVKFEADNREYLRWTNFSSQASAARKKKFTFSVWVKRTELDIQQIFISTSQNGYLTFEANNQLTWIQQYGGSQLVINTTRVFRDTAAWYHIMVVVDTAQSTEADRTKIYVNGVQETVFDAAAYPSQNAEASNLFEQHLIVGEWGGTQNGFCGYMADYYFLSETAASPTDLGEFDEDSGIWKPKAYSGTISSPSHFLEFKDGSDLGTATAGLDSDYQNNLTAADQATDTPTNNFCTFNPLQTVRLNTGSGHKWTISNGATSAIQAADYGYMTHAGNIGFKKGKWYAEFKAGTGTSQAGVGMNQLDNTGAWEESYIGAYANATAIGMCKSQDGYFYRNGGSGALGVSWAAGDILGIAIVINDDGTGFMGMSKNGTWENSQNPSSGTSGMLGLYHGNALPAHLFHSFAVWTRRNNGAMLANFGGFPGFTISSANADANGYGNFEYAVPTGYYALCTKNLEEFG